MGIILARFKTNYEALLKQRQSLEGTWAKLCENAFYKSLDHRAFHFKAFERKQQLTKAYIADIRAI